MVPYSGIMPKGGRGVSSKKSAAPSISNEEDSNVVFGDASSTKKARKTCVDNDRGSKVGAALAEGPKKPDTRTLIAGASWTGKLPVNMLSEHCQKQKWAKPEYTMVESSFIVEITFHTNTMYRLNQQKVSLLW